MALTQLIFANNAGSQLNSPINSSQVTISIKPGTGALFPLPGSNQYFPVTAVDSATGLLREIMFCTARSGDTLTVIRGQEGTTARSYGLYDPIANLWTAGQAAAMAQTNLLGSASTINASDQLGTVSAVQVYAGNPNGHVAGVAAVVGTSAPSCVWDTSDKIFWVCTTTGSTSTAVWYASGSTQGATYCGLATGTANAIILTPTIPAVSYSAGLSLAFLVAAKNTGATTVNVSGIGAVNIYKESPTGPIALTGGELVTGNLVTMRFDGTRFQLTATELGTAALADASSNTGVVAAVTGSGTITPGNMAWFNSSDGTIRDGGLYQASQGVFSSSSKTVSAGTWLVDTTAGVITLTLPISPLLGDACRFIDVGGVFGIYNLIVGRNGSTIMNKAENLICNLSGEDFMLWYNGTTWRIQ
jgi:hypothetical protein